jgi:hypothetical protein
MVWKWAHPKHLPNGRPSGPHNQAQSASPPPQPEAPEGTHTREWGLTGSFWAPSSQSQSPDRDDEAPHSWDKLPKSEQANSPGLIKRYQEWSAKAEDHLLSTWALSQSELEASRGQRSPPYMENWRRQ